MFESGVIYVDVAIGLAVAFFLLSLLSSGINEALAFVTRIRSKFLWAYLNQLFTKAPEQEAAATSEQDSAARKAERFVPTGAAPAPLAAAAPVDSQTRDALNAATTEVAAAVSSPAARLSAGLPSTSWEMLRLMRARGTRDPRPTLGGCGLTGRAHEQPETEPIVAELHRRLGPIAVAANAKSVTDPKVDKPTTTKHIPPRSLAVALIDLLSGSGVITAQVEAKLDGLAGTPIHSTLVSLWTSTDRSLEKFRDEVEALFDAEMARLSGLYKRLMRWVLLTAALLAAMLVNLDAFGLTRDLWRDPDRRSELVAVAGAIESTGAADKTAPELATLYAACRADTASQGSADADAGDDAVIDPQAAAEAYDRLRTCVTDALDAQTELGLFHDSVTSGNWWASYHDDWVVGRVLKNLIVAAAIFFGAPFWWDVIRRLMGIRKSAAKPET